MFLKDFDSFVTAYMECALWTCDDSEGDPLNLNYDTSDISEASRFEMWKDCAAFVGMNYELLKGLEASQAGHDFWLTRNRHGAGFWDRKLGETGDKLTDSAHRFGEKDLYVGDGGLVYI